MKERRRPRVHELASELGIGSQELIRIVYEQVGAMLKPGSTIVSVGLEESIRGWVVAKRELKAREEQERSRQMLEEERQRAEKRIESCHGDSVLLAVLRGADEDLRTALNDQLGCATTTSDGLSALHLAAIGNSPTKVSILIDRGISPNVATANGMTPLHVAAKQNAIEAARVLLQRGADADAAANARKWDSEDEQGGDRPLHLAVKNNHIEMARLLLDAGASVSARDSRYDTALHLAAWNADMAEVLLQRGADINKVGARDQTVEKFIVTELDSWRYHLQDCRSAGLLPGSPPDRRILRLIRKYERGRDVDLPNLKSLTLSQLGELVDRRWVSMEETAREYLLAWASCESLEDNYGLDRASELVARFLAVSTRWRGKCASSIKKELKRRLDQFHNGG